MSRQALTRSFVALSIAVGCAGLTWAQAAPPQKVASVEGITEYRLDNGLRVLLFPDPSRPKVTVNLTVFVGSRHEGYGETGHGPPARAHALQGDARRIPTSPRSSRSAGPSSTARPGSIGPITTRRCTASDENLEFALELEADRLVNSFIKGADLATEMTVVRNEFEMGENSPENVLEQRMMAVAYEWHNYGKSTIGNRSDIERVPIERLQGFYRKHYRPDNALLVVAGRFDEKKALDLIARYFGALPRPESKLDTPYTEEPAQDGERIVTLRRVGDVGVVGVLYHIPAGRTPGVRGGADLDPDPDLGPLGPALQGPRRDQEGVAGRAARITRCTTRERS